MTDEAKSMKAGDKVKILGRRRTLVRPMPNIAGGWVVDAPVDGFRFWHISDMQPWWRPVSKGLSEGLQQDCKATP